VRDDRVAGGQLADLARSQRLAGTFDGLDIARRMHGGDRRRIGHARTLERRRRRTAGLEPGDECIKAGCPLGMT
jgi:hypothetical protein